MTSSYFILPGVFVIFSSLRKVFFVTCPIFFLSRCICRLPEEAGAEADGGVTGVRHTDFLHQFPMFIDSLFIY